MVTSSTPTPMRGDEAPSSMPKRVVCAAMMPPVAAAYHSSEKVKMARRPKRSATCANRMVPTNSPAKVTDANAAWSGRPNSPSLALKMPARMRPGLT